MALASTFIEPRRFHPARLAGILSRRLGPVATFGNTEHFNLQAARSVTVAESNGQASVYAPRQAEGFALIEISPQTDMPVGEHRPDLRGPIQAPFHLARSQVQLESPGANHASANRSAAAWLQLAGAARRNDNARARALGDLPDSPPRFLAKSTASAVAPGQCVTFTGG